MYRDLLGIPYEYGTMDCVILAQEVFRRHNKHVPIYEAVRTAIESIDSEAGRNKFLVDTVESTWQELEKPIVPCLVLIPTATFMLHVGVYIGENKFIHISRMRKYPTIESLDNPLYANRKFYTFNGDPEPV